MKLQQSKTPVEMLVFASVFEGALLLVAYLMGWFADIDPLETATSELSAVLVGLLAVIPLLALLWWGVQNPYSRVGTVTRQASDFVSQYLGGTSVAGFAFISLLAGLGEEALFRGVLQVLIGKYSNVWIGLIAASALFGLAHAVSRAYAVVAGIIGAYLGLLYLYTGNIVAPIVCHAAYDFIALVCLSRFRSTQ